MKNSLLVHKHLIVRAEAVTVAIIETSHIAMHIWDEINPALMQFDVYSCGNLDVEAICKKIKEDFNIQKIEYKFLNRETGLQDI